MINRATIRNFKRFAEQSFDLADAVVLAGPNNSGKSTLLQAIATWRLGFDRWTSQRKGIGRYGVPITRSDFTAVPLREMNLLWEDRKVVIPPKNKRRLIEIILEGKTQDEKWECGFEFEYDGSEQVYVRPLHAKKLPQDVIQQFPPQPAADLKIIHVPPLSGINRDEPRHERGMQDLLVGQGRPGEILRNLLWEIAERSPDDDWRKVTEHIGNLFGIELIKPSYSSAQPFIVCEYNESGHSRPLDLSNVGSGTLQVLLLLAFLYSRPATTILLDEPDSHQHIILQAQVYELIRKVARERQGQIIIATHSEVILDATEPTRVFGFFGEPRLLADETERGRLHSALKRVTTMDFLLGRETGAILYVESETDEKILKEWASVLQHPSRRFFKRPFVHYLRSRNLKEASTHFVAMQVAFPRMCGLCLIDGDNRDEPDEEIKQSGLVVLRWKRYEIENYLMQPEAIKRMVPPLPLWQQLIEDKFWKLVPRETDLLGDHPALIHSKASNEYLVPWLKETGSPTPKRDLYLLAARMMPEEIHPEVKEKLDRIEEALCP